MIPVRPAPEKILLRAGFRSRPTDKFMRKPMELCRPLNRSSPDHLWRTGLTLRLNGRRTDAVFLALEDDLDVLVVEGGLFFFGGRGPADVDAFGVALV